MLLENLNLTSWSKFTSLHTDFTYFIAHRFHFLLIYKCHIYTSHFQLRHFFSWFKNEKQFIQLKYLNYSHLRWLVHIFILITCINFSTKSVNQSVFIWLSWMHYFKLLGVMEFILRIWWTFIKFSVWKFMKFFLSLCLFVNMSLNSMAKLKKWEKKYNK